MAYLVGQNVAVTFGERIKTARLELMRSKNIRLTQADIAAAVGVQRNTVSRWENGGMLPKDPQVVAALAKVLEVTADWLIGGLGNDSRSGSGPVEEGPSTYKVTISAAEDLPSPVADQVLRYLERLSHQGCPQPQVAEAEAFMVRALQHSLTAKPFHKRSIEEIQIDVDLAWDFVVAVMRRSGIRA